MICFPSSVNTYTPLTGVSRSLSSVSILNVFLIYWRLIPNFFDISRGVILGFCAIVSNISMATMAITV